MSPFVVIEGLDGAGTTTQVERLVTQLRADGADVFQTREPTGGPIGKVIRRSLSADPEAPPVEALPWMFAADRADHVFRFVEPARARGTWVVSDRYVPSSLAYQSLTLPLEQVFALNAHFPVPDALIYVDVAVDMCLERIGGRDEAREIYERKGQLVAIDAAYHRVLDRLRARGDRVDVVDGAGTVDEVADAIQTIVRRVVAWPSSSRSRA